MTALQRSDRKDLLTFDQSKIALLKATVAKDATDSELQLFLHLCQRTGLDPFARQIYFQKRYSKRYGHQMTVLTGIDGYRLIADRTGLYVGNDDPIYDVEAVPRKATVTVYKLIGGMRCPFTASSRWDQYYPGDEQGFLWKKMPHLMLGKTAEALALRKAFPAELSGLYTDAEMEQADRTPPPDVSPQPDRKPSKVLTIEAKANPFLAPPDIERYQGSIPQCKIVRELARTHGVTELEDLKALGKVLLGPTAVEMEHIAQAVAQWCKGRTQC